MSARTLPAVATMLLLMGSAAASPSAGKRSPAPAKARTPHARFVIEPGYMGIELLRLALPRDARLDLSGSAEISRIQATWTAPRGGRHEVVAKLSLIPGQPSAWVRTPRGELRVTPAGFGHVRQLGQIYERGILRDVERIFQGPTALRDAVDDSNRLLGGTE